MNEEKEELNVHPRHYYMTTEWAMRIEQCFTYHAPFGDQPERYVHLRQKAKELATAIAECCPDSREKSLAMTELQSVTMWANSSIACNEKPWEDYDHDHLTS